MFVCMCARVFVFFGLSYNFINYFYERLNEANKYAWQLVSYFLPPPTLFVSFVCFVVVAEFCIFVA